MEEFTSDEALEQAKANAEALSLVMIGYVKEKRLPIDEFWDFVGEKFTLGWESVQGKGVIPDTGKATVFPTTAVRIGFDDGKISKVHDPGTGPDAGMAGFLKALGVDMG